VILNALGLFRPNETELKRDAPDALVYTSETVAAVDVFRAAEKLSGPALGSPPGLVDGDTVARMWTALEKAGKADAVRQSLLESTAVRR
jgi:peptidoglycan hydrolase-like protein with peptidoglycan-binding domain